jgi:uncharacterized protein (TIGR03067 family)
MGACTLTMLTASIVIVANLPDGNEAQEKLQGRWILVGGEEKGESFGEEDAKKEGLVLLIKEDSLTMLEHGRNKEGTLKISLDPSKKPAAIDLTYTEGKHKGKTNHAIYSVEKDSLKICVSRKLLPNEPAERPMEFKTKVAKEDSDLRGMVLLVFQRQKKSAESK